MNSLILGFLLCENSRNQGKLNGRGDQYGHLVDINNILASIPNQFQQGRKHGQQFDQNRTVRNKQFNRSKSTTKKSKL